MNHIPIQIRKIHPDEYGLLREFLYQAIYLPEGAPPPPHSVVDLPELQVYIAGFGTHSGDDCLVAEVEGTVVGAAWSRIMEDYGHIDSSTPIPGHLNAAGIPWTWHRDPAAERTSAFTAGEWVSPGIPLCSEREPGAAPV